MRKADLVASISEKTGVPKVDVLVALEMFFKEVKGSLADGQNVYIRGFGSFIIKKRAKKIGRHIKKNKAIEIPEHFIPAFKPAKIFVEQVKENVSSLPSWKFCFHLQRHECKASGQKICHCWNHHHHFAILKMYLDEL